MDSENLNLYFREIVFQNPASKKISVCGVFSYEASTIEDAQLGNIYIVGEISNVPKKKHKNSDFLLNLLASVIKREFYANPKRKTLEALESALQSANIYLADFVKKGHDEWIGNLHLACLVFSQNDIHVGQTGEIIVRLFRGNTISNISKKFQDQEESDPIKTFSSIASGKIEKGDKILIATNKLSEILSASKTKDLIAYPSADRLYHYIKDNLVVSSLACLVLEAENHKPEEKTEKPIEEKPVEIKIDLKQILDFKVEKINQIVAEQITFPNKLTNFFLRHHIIKYILVLFLTLTIILSPYLVVKINYALKIRKINNLLQRTLSNIERSELSLTYQNKTEARIFLKQASIFLDDINTLFKALPNDAKTKVSKNLLSIQELFDQQKNSLNNIIEIVQMEKLADLSKNTYSFNPNGVLKLRDILYLYETTSGFVYKINLADPNDNSLPLIFLSSKDTFKLGAATDTEILLLADPERIAVYNLNQIFNLYLLKPNLENTLNIKDMVSFENSLFFLDVQKQNILKYSPTENVLNGAYWLKSASEDLRDAVSLAIDGDIFVSKENGTIIQFTQGKKLKEIKFDINPLISKGGQLFTKPNFKSLYVLDSGNKRIVSYSKKDGLIKQYALADLSNLKDFWVDDDEKTIFLLNGLEVYKIEI